MSITDHRYFRRGSDGTRVLDHAEIRELMFATREGSLEIKCTIRTGGSTTQLYALWLVLTLRNNGRIPVVAPYVRLKQPGWKSAPSLEVWPRTAADGTYGVYTSRDVLVHLNDEIGMAEFETGLDFRGTGQHELKAAVATAKTVGMEHTYSMSPWEAMHREGGFPAPNRSAEIDGFYGAENASVKDFRFKIDKTGLLAMFCQHMSIDL
jgi:hypothetical protein